MTDLDVRIHEVFTEVVGYPPSEWPRMLDERCDTPELRAAVQRLLDLHVTSGDFLSHPATGAHDAFAGSIGEQIAEFKIEREIGRGGMGTVYLARDTILNRSVALKVVAYAPDADDVAARRFRKEAQAAARLDHPNIARIFRSGEERGVSYIAMEYVEGETFRARLDASAHVSMDERAHDTPRLRELAVLISEVADALEHAHRHDVIHRDVKPSNIMVDRHRHARLTDFGVARITTEQTLLKQDDIAGSYAYMSPEQAHVRSVEIDHRTDVFSLGVVLYEALARRRPFEGSTPQEILKALGEGRPRSLHKVCRSLPEELVTICHKAIELDPSYRYQTAGHMSADLRSFATGHAILARPASRLRKASAWIRRHQRSVLATCALVFLCLTGVLGYTAQQLYRATQGHLIVPESHRGAQVSASRFNIDLTLGPVQELGTAPLSVFLHPGLYRVHIVADDRHLEASSFLAAGEIDTIEVRPPADEDVKSFVFIPGGAYPLGKSLDDSTLMRQRTVTLNAFRISPTEVTNAEYREFVLATGATPPSTWPTPYDPAIDELPVSMISWDEANHYCRWRGVRLPTPDEWEAAARGPTGNVFPWGNAPRPDLTRIDLDVNDMRDAYFKAAQPVDSDEEFATPLGVMHLASNVQEYTEGIDGERNNGLVIKGRSWADAGFMRPWTVQTLSVRHMGAPNRGFRVALSMEKGNESQ